MGEVDETLEDLFIRIEGIVGKSATVNELKEVKMQYIKEHRYVLEYFNLVQNEIEEELC